MSKIAENYQKVLEEIEAARACRTRVPKDAPVQLIAVTKNHDVEAMREAIDAGATDVGENRVQEAMKKLPVLDRKVTWHLIGHLQTNKAKHAVEHFSLIHSVDTPHLVRAIDKEAGKLDKVQDILVQVNLAKEESKSGVYKEDLRPLLELTDELPHVRLRGLMLIAPNYDDVEQCRPLFHEMYEIFQKVKEFPFQTANITYLSMGMTHDYRIAVEEGANMVRVGTAIFGPRQY
ncbi:MAG: YggS family pyridoxal phosphate-dependent enzyme [Selenomonadaceae bacterium]|nr:YggS family pyridoxal phosphate-dependent enzyme [Selenomonadaceae bacterium]